MRFSDAAAPADLIDLARYPVTELDSAAGRAVLAEAQRARRRASPSCPAFWALKRWRPWRRTPAPWCPGAHREDVAAGTPYLELPDESFPAGHPRRTAIRSATWVIAYDLIPHDSPIRALYEWEPLMAFIGAVLERDPLYRFADRLGALNLTSMLEGDVQGWHYDSTDFVVSIAIQAPRGGGLFECAPRIRNQTEEHYDAVARVLAGEGPSEVFPFTPGTMMVFEGRHSIHRVTPVAGEVPRYVALLAYDTKPGTDSSDLLKLVRYGRTEPVAQPKRD
jgi:hypothetical protein